MRVVLKNFKQHQNLEMEFQRSGLFMLQGPSGVGKTTVFDAIFEALTGEADDVAPWGSSSSLVELFDFQPDGLSYIKRTRGPKTLLVRDAAGNEYKDEAAQAFINKSIGMETHDFLASSYIQQEMSGSLLKLPPAEQLRFIQKLGAGAEDPEADREKIQALVRNRDAAAAIAASAVTRLLPYAQRAEADLRAAEFTEPVAPMSQAEMDKKYEAYLEAVKSHAKAHTDAQIVHSTLRNPLYETIRTLGSLRQANQAIIDDSNKELELLKAEDEALRAKADPSVVTNAANRKPLLFAKRKRLETIDQMKALAATVVQKYGQMGGNVIEFLDHRLAEVQRLSEIAKADKTAALAKTNDLENMNDPQHCPACAAPLILEGKKIVSAPNVRPPDWQKRYDAAGKEFLDAQWRVLDTDKEILYIRDLQTKAAMMKASLGDDTAPECKTIADVDAAIAALDDAIGTQKVIESAINKLMIKKESLVAKIYTSSKTIVDAEAKIASAKLPPEAEVKAAAADADNVANACLQNVESYAPFLKVRSDYLAAVTKRNLQASHYETLAGVCRRAKEDYTAALSTSIVAEEKLAAAKRLKELSDQAAVMSIELNIEKINENAKVLIDRMFPDDGTSVRIKNTTETKGGDSKPKLSVEIFHKGKVAKKLSSLSGGERSRITLAFQLALGEMYKSPILLVDEGFAGLPEEQIRQCLELLKEASADRLILAIEHGAPESMFDEVFRLE